MHRSRVVFLTSPCSANASGTRSFRLLRWQALLNPYSLHNHSFVGPAEVFVETSEKPAVAPHSSESILEPPPRQGKAGSIGMVNREDVATLELHGEDRGRASLHNPERAGAVHH